MVDTAYKLVHFGWKKEVIPISQPKINNYKLFDLFSIVVIFRNISCFNLMSFIKYNLSLCLRFTKDY